MQAPKIHIQNLSITLPTPTASPIASILAHAALSYLAEKPNPAPGRFELACNGEAVIDHKTGLMWARDNIGGVEMNWEDANKAAQAVFIGGHDGWRLPEIDELLSIVDYTRSSPAINTDFFNCEPAYYWAKTPYAPSSSVYAWFVYFGGGSSYFYHRDGECRVRACRRVRSPSQ